MKYYFKILNVGQYSEPIKMLYSIVPNPDYPTELLLNINTVSFRYRIMSNVRLIDFTNDFNTLEGACIAAEQN